MIVSDCADYHGIRIEYPLLSKADNFGSSNYNSPLLGLPVASQLASTQGKLEIICRRQRRDRLRLDTRGKDCHRPGTGRSMPAPSSKTSAELSVHSPPPLMFGSEWECEGRLGRICCRQLRPSPTGRPYNENHIVRTNPMPWTCGTRSNA